jgi:hypothetical protein
MSLALVTALMNVTFFGCFLYFAIRDGPPKASDVILASIGFDLTAIGALATWWMRRRRSDAETIISAALNFAWLGNAVLCLTAFQESRDPGWWLSLAIAVPISAELLWHIFRSFRQA